MIKNIGILIMGLMLMGLAFMLIARKSKKNAADMPQQRPLVLYNWSQYMDPAVLVQFEEETGIKVVEDVFDSNETLRSKMLAGAEGYDVVVPSGVMIEALIREGLLEKIDYQKVPNIKNIDPFFRGLYFDPKNEYSVPYMFGSTGIGYRKDLVAEAPTGWAALFDPTEIARYKGKVSLLDDPRETIAAALQYLRFSVNSTEPAEIDAAIDVLIKQKEFLARYDSEVYNDFLISGDAVVVHGWAGTITKAILKKPEIAYIVPKEGGIMGLDCFVIPKNSKKKEDALRFIDFILRPEISAQIVNKTYYPSANKAADPLIDRKIRNNSGIYPDKSAIEKMEWLKDVGVHNELYEKAWERIRFSK